MRNPTKSPATRERRRVSVFLPAKLYDRLVSVVQQQLRTDPTASISKLVAATLAKHPPERRAA